jgi:hypothetical protein
MQVHDICPSAEETTTIAVSTEQTTLETSTESVVSSEYIYQSHLECNIFLIQRCLWPTLQWLPTTNRVFTCADHVVILYDFCSDCLVPRIILIPSTSSLSAPFSYRRNQDFFVGSVVQWNCNRTAEYTSRWTFHLCPRSCTTSPTSVPSSIARNFSELYVPSRTLKFGLYQLKLTVTIANRTNTLTSASAFVRITPSGMTANLIQFGTSFITRGHDQDLLLHPGRYSVDYDQSTFNASVSDRCIDL